MTVIAFANSTGASGKTTATFLAATEFARMGYKVTVLDADPKGQIGDWATLAGECRNMVVEPGVSQVDIEEHISVARRRSDFVFIDVPSDMSNVAALAVGNADHVVIPVQEASVETIEADAVFSLLASLKDGEGRAISHSVMLTRQYLEPEEHAAVEARNSLKKCGLNLLRTVVVERRAFSEVLRSGKMLHRVDPATAWGLAEARENLRAFAVELRWALPIVRRKRTVASVPAISGAKLAA